MLGPDKIAIQVTNAAVKFKFMVYITNKLCYISFILTSQKQAVSGSVFLSFPNTVGGGRGQRNRLVPLSITLLWFLQIAQGIVFLHVWYIHYGTL